MNYLFKNFPWRFDSRSAVSLNKEFEVLKGLIEVGCRSYGGLGGDYETYRINFFLNSEGLRRISIALLMCSFGEKSDFYIPMEQPGLARGLRFFSPVSKSEDFTRSKSFTYTPRRELKRHPWYPWSRNCDAMSDLPAFGIIGVPGECDSVLWDNRRDLQKPYAVCIGGSAKALIRLARLLLDYANTDMPPEEIDLEIEGGFRGVGPCSYEARFVRVDGQLTI